MLRLGAGAMRRTGGARRLLRLVTRQPGSRQTPQEQLMAVPGERRQRALASGPQALQMATIHPEKAKRELGRRSRGGKLRASPATGRAEAANGDRPMELPWKMHSTLSRAWRGSRARQTRRRTTPRGRRCIAAAKPARNESAARMHQPRRTLLLGRCFGQNISSGSAFVRGEEEVG